MKIQKSCHLVEQIGDEFFCDCFEGSKARLCKHAVGLMFKTGVLEIIAGRCQIKTVGAKEEAWQTKEVACMFSEKS